MVVVMVAVMMVVMVLHASELIRLACINPSTDRLIGSGWCIHPSAHPHTHTRTLNVSPSCWRK